ncbi:MAG: penicillin acylase family protein [Deltaproteobacteria bacterium]|nr:penicillin acylase family protein [Deltaproteobacteria bacterium]
MPELRGRGRISIRRDENGVPHIEADHEADLYKGLGYCHAMDRGMQLLLTRILGRGQACEMLSDNDEMLAIDVFFRRFNATGGIAAQESRLPDDVRALCLSYCEGVNMRLAEKIPFEMRLLKYRPDPWTFGDCILLSRLAGFIGLAQSQGEIERFIVEMILNGVDRPRLEEMFPGKLEGLDLELIRKTRLHDRLIPEAILWQSPIPRMMASNNWVVAGSRTASGKPILANDPHLEVNRLPNVWYEAALKTRGRFVMGATMPGLPNVLFGRSNDLAWGVTYTFMDALDSWVEHCKDGAFRRVDSSAEKEQWIKFHVRRETIRRKKHPPVERVFYENQHGTLDGDFGADDRGAESFRLATRWSSADSGADSVAHMFRMAHAKTVEEGMRLIGKLELSFNWGLADRNGSIGYQMSGKMPKRREGVSGLIPLPGWDARNDWQGFVAPEELPRALNPKEGFLVTANNDLNHLGTAKPINNPMGSYRADRIAKLLSEKPRLTAEDCFAIQYDLYSPQAERYMKFLRPMLADTPPGRILRDWDGRYDASSVGATVFENFFGALFRKVFGEFGFGTQVSAHLLSSTALFADFYNSFENVLLSERSAWFAGKSRDTLYREALDEALRMPARPWGKSRKITLANLFFGGKLPRFLGFDRGPITLIGGRATVSQGQVFRNGGRATTFAPSIRFVADLATEICRTNLCGGPSDRRFSKWYVSDLKNWMTGKYKTLRP